jgi:tripartite-type tricarboxylate transporter receptor subunit TctC
MPVHKPSALPPALSRRSLLAGAASAASIAALPGLARAQAYPSRHVTIVVPFAPGGTGDIVARNVAPLLGARLGREVIVENRTGAGGAIGWAAVANSARDGYTLLASDTSFAMAAAVIPKQPFDPRKDFVHIGTTATVPFVVVVRPGLEARTLQELIALARANPGKLNYGSAGNGSSSHLGCEWFKYLTKTYMVHVPYRGGAGVVQDLLAGQVDVAFLAVPSVLQHVRSGKLRILAVSSPARLSALPAVPTAIEAGLPKFVGAHWFGLSAREGTPEPIVTRLNTELNAVLASPEIKAKFDGAGLDPAPATPQAAAAYVQADIERWVTVVKAASIKPE